MDGLYQIMIFLIAFFILGGVGQILQDPVKFLLIWAGIYIGVQLIIYHYKYVNKLYLKKTKKQKVKKDANK